METSEALEAPAAEAFFTAVSAQLSYSADPVAAFRLAVDALEKYVELREQDEVYAGKVGMTALLGSQLADIAAGVDDAARRVLRRDPGLPVSRRLTVSERPPVGGAGVGDGSGAVDVAFQGGGPGGVPERDGQGRVVAVEGDDGELGPAGDLGGVVCRPA